MRTKQKLSETAQHEVEWNSLFAVGKNVEGKHWTNFITWLRKAKLNTYHIFYIVAAHNNKLKLALCYIQYSSNSYLDIKQLTKNLGFEDVCLQDEIKMFYHLPISSIMFTSMVKQVATQHVEKGSLINADVISKDCFIPKFNMDDILSLLDFASNNAMTLIVEEVEEGIEIKHGYAIQVKNLGLLGFSMQKIVRAVHIIYPSLAQCYHGFRFHQNPHYGVRVKQVPLIKWMLQYLNIEAKDYKSSVTHHHNYFLTIDNNIRWDWFPYNKLYSILKKNRLRSRNISNYFLSYGYSAMYCGKNGEPRLTTFINKITDGDEGILPLVLPVLVNLSSIIKRHYGHIALDTYRNTNYAQKLGYNLGYHLSEFNIYEGFDVSLVYSDSLIKPHCDVMNDWRPGYNYLSVIKSTFWDDDINLMVTLSVICYTRKGIGDYLCKMRSSLACTPMLPSFDSEPMSLIKEKMNYNCLKRSSRGITKKLVQVCNRVKVAMNLKLNDETSFKLHRKNKEYLLLAGYSENTINDQLIKHFWDNYSCCRNKMQKQIPPHLQSYNKHWIKVVKTSEVIEGMFPVIKNLLLNMEGEKGQFKVYDNSNVTKSVLYTSTGCIHPKYLNVINNIKAVSVGYMMEIGLGDVGVNLNNIVIYGVFINGNSERIQNPHTAYPYIHSHQREVNVSKTSIKKADTASLEFMLSWTAYMPITNEGMWITIWFGPGYGYALKVNLGETLFLRSDVVFAVTVPLTENADWRQKYYHLQYYLPSDSQPPHPNNIFTQHFDNITDFSHLYCLPKISFY